MKKIKKSKKEILQQIQQQNMQSQFGFFQIQEALDVMNAKIEAVREIFALKANITVTDEELTPIVILHRNKIRRNRQRRQHIASVELRQSKDIPKEKEEFVSGVLKVLNEAWFGNDISIKLIELIMIEDELTSIVTTLVKGTDIEFVTTVRDVNDVEKADVKVGDNIVMLGQSIKDLKEKDLERFIIVEEKDGTKS